MTLLPSIASSAIALALMIVAPAANALEAGTPGYADPRIKTYVYDPAQVFRIVGHFGFVTTVQFAKGEAVESVQLGDHVSWQVDRLKRGDMLSIVPIERGGAFTNMLVATSKRIYSFDMTARHAPHGIEGNAVTFLYRFDYPKTVQEIDAERIAKAKAQAEEARAIRSIEDVASKAKDPSRINRAYRASGPEYLKPASMLDDGQKTYIRFPDGTPMPAVFAVRPDRTEAVLNHSILPDGTLVVHAVRSRLTLRGPEGVICIYNDARLKQEGAASAEPPISHRSQLQAQDFTMEDRHDR